MGREIAPRDEFGAGDAMAAGLEPPLDLSAAPPDDALVQLLVTADASLSSQADHAALPL